MGSRLIKLHNRRIALVDFDTSIGIIFKTINKVEDDPVIIKKIKKLGIIKHTTAINLTYEAAVSLYNLLQDLMFDKFGNLRKEFYNALKKEMQNKDD